MVVEIIYNTSPEKSGGSLHFLLTFCLKRGIIHLFEERLRSDPSRAVWQSSTAHFLYFFLYIIETMKTIDIQMIAVMQTAVFISSPPSRFLSRAFAEIRCASPSPFRLRGGFGERFFGALFFPDSFSFILPPFLFLRDIVALSDRPYHHGGEDQKPSRCDSEEYQDLFH